MTDTFETRVGEKRGTVVSWASILETNTREQAEMISRGNVTYGHVALMPDAHLGRGACIGTAIRTLGGIYPAAVGVDIGCGMIAVETSIEAVSLDLDARRRLHHDINRRVPSGVGQRRTEVHPLAHKFVEEFGWAPSIEDGSLAAARPKVYGKRGSPQDTALMQFGTLGAGNHFVELAVDEQGMTWAIVHSGSRGIGNNIAQVHVESAQERCADTDAVLEDRDLAFLLEGDPRFDRYIADMQWAQAYAFGQRECMMNEVLVALSTELRGRSDVEYERRRVNCHHNYSEELRTDKGWPSGMWLSRKGAIDASEGVLGVIPGSMGTDTYIVSGLGNALSYNTAPHGAGRVSARGRPEKTRKDGTIKKATGAYARFTVDEFQERMSARIVAGHAVVWQDRSALNLLDESPMVYKQIEVVMADAVDLVEPVARLEQFVNCKGM